jgi:protein-tyrosine-phosphatase
MKKVLFVCTANICRSPMAEAIFEALAKDEDLPVRVESAGITALEGELMDPNARKVLEEVGIYTEGRSARKVNETMLKEADLVLAMTPHHVAELRRLFGDYSYKIYTLPGYANGADDNEGIPDPYGLTVFAYRVSVRQLFEYIDRVVKGYAMCKGERP